MQKIWMSNLLFFLVNWVTCFGKQKLGQWWWLLARDNPTSFEYCHLMGHGPIILKKNLFFKFNFGMACLDFHKVSN